MTANLGAELPQYPGLRWHGVLNVQGIYPLRVLLLADVFQGVWVHWIKNLENPKGTALPCPEDGPCWACRDYGLRWNGYIAAYHERERKPRVLHLTEGCARQLLAYKNQHGTLRGLAVTLQRTGNRPNGPVNVVSAGLTSASIVPDDFDIMPSLRRMFGVSATFKFRRKSTEFVGDRSVECDPDLDAAIVPFNRVERDQADEKGGGR